NTLRLSVSSSRPANAPRAPRWFPSPRHSTTSFNFVWAVFACRRQSVRIAEIRCSSVNGFGFVMRFSLSVWLRVPPLGIDPEFELPDGFAFHRHLDMRVKGIHFLTGGVAHQDLPHVLQHSRLHEAGVERVAKIVKSEVANAGSADGCLPCRLDPVNRTALEGKDQPTRFLE